ncbi:Acyl carrier protein [Zea mays]|uniref:Acyl carrier protein n=1 Tax=Zea mays TaxID=4577 RepID=A0A1D6QMW8_MAIZE|nr:Acyl carrier protein [Zea mays]
MASIAGSSALSFAMPVKAINSNSLAFSPVRKGNTFLRLQPVPMRSVSCAVSFILGLTMHKYIWRGFSVS